MPLLHRFSSLVRSPSSLDEALGFSTAFLCIATFVGALRFGSLTIPALFLAGAAILLGLVALWKGASRVSPYGAAAALPLLFLSDYSDRPFTFLFFERLLLLELLAGALTAVAVLRLFPANGWRHVLLLTCSWAIFYFLHRSGGQLLFSDDHASFFYRLTQLREHFPSIPYYNPLWNAGVEAREFFPSGILNVYLLFFPLIQLFPVEYVYNVIVALLLFGIVPASMFAAARLLSMDRRAASIAALLCLSSSLYWYRWALAYGTLGFITSAALLPLTLALSVRFISDRRSWLETVALCATASCTALWSPSLLAVLPLVPFAACALKRIARDPRSIFIVLLAVCLNLLWITIFVRASKVDAFLQQSTNQATLTEQSENLRGPASSALRSENLALSLSNVAATLHEDGTSFNPLTITLSLSGLFLLPSIRHRALLGGVLVWMLLLGSIGAVLVPRLELNRLLVVLGHLLALPAAAAVSAMMAPAKSKYSTLLAFIAFGGLMLSPLHLFYLLSGRTSEQFHFESPTVAELSRVITSNAGDGRTMFLGFISHELSHGHVAPLAYYTGKPLMASSYQHDVWRYTDIMPPQFLARGYRGAEEFFKLHNVSLLIGHELYWRQFLQNRPKLYELVWRKGKFVAYKRLKYSSQYFLSGEGSVVEQCEGALKLTLATSDAVVKFRYYDFLTADHCSIEPHEVYPGRAFMVLRNCPVNTPITIRAKPPLQRFFAP